MHLRSSIDGILKGLMCIVVGVVAAIFLWPLFSMRHGTAPTGRDVKLRGGIELPQEWTDIRFASHANCLEFVATGDEASWRKWCKQNNMPSEHPDDIGVSRLPTMGTLEIDLGYDFDSSQALLLMRSRVTGAGALRVSWYDRDRKRIIYQEAFW
jgi:hypothetical protein